MTRTRFIAVLVLIIAGALALTLPRLMGSLAWVEPLSANMAALEWRELSTNLRYESPAPLYFVLLKLWRDLFGESEIALRSLSLLMMVVSIVAIALVGSAFAEVDTTEAPSLERRGLAQKTGLVTAALFAVSSSVTLHYGTVVRFYALLTLLAIVLIWAWLHILRNSDTLSIVLFAVVGIAGLLTHPLFVFVVFALTGSGIFFGRSIARCGLLAALLAVTCYLLLLHDYLFAGFENSLVWVTEPRPIFLRELVLNLWGPVATGILFLGVAVIVRSSPGRSWSSIPLRLQAALGLSLILAMLFPYVISRLFFLYNLNFITVLILPVAALLLAGILAATPQRLLPGAVLAAVFCLSVVNAVSLMRPNAQLHSERAFQALASRSRCGDVWLAVGQGANEARYYLRRLGLDQCHRLEVFPAEAIQSPGVLFPREWVQINYDLLLENAERLATRFAVSRRRIFWLRNTRREEHLAGLEEIVQKELLKQAVTVEVLHLQGDLFDQVVVFDPA